MKALITGVTGQDGSYLAQQLDAVGVRVTGLLRGQRHPKRAWLEKLVPGIYLIEGDMLDQSSLQHALKVAEPDVVYNLAALTYVGMSWQQPTVMTEVTGLGVLRLLEAVRTVNPQIRVVQASSSEMFGGGHGLSARAQLAPRSPYGVAKAFAHHTVVNYRESHGLHCSAAIMFNHESPRRGPEFVTRKVSLAVAAIAAGKERWLRLGRLDTRRDWGWAPDYMQALPLIAAGDEPDDYVLATGETYSVQDLVRLAFFHAGIDNWQDYVVHDESLLRPADVDYLQGDASKAAADLGWRASVMFPEIVRRLVEHDVQAQDGAL